MDVESPSLLLQSARNRLGLTQAQAAEGIAKLSLYSKFETQVVYPTPERVRLLCERLGVDSELLRVAIDHYKTTDREIRLASRRQDFKAVFRLCIETMEGELTETVQRRYLDKARIAWSLGGGVEVRDVVAK